MVNFSRMEWVEGSQYKIGYFKMKNIKIQDSYLHILKSNWLFDTV